MCIDLVAHIRTQVSSHVCVGEKNSRHPSHPNWNIKNIFTPQIY